MAFLYQVIMKKRNLQNERKQLPLTIQRCIDVANYYIGSSSFFFFMSSLLCTLRTRCLSCARAQGSMAGRRPSLHSPQQVPRPAGRTRDPCPLPAKRRTHLESGSTEELSFDAPTKMYKCVFKCVVRYCFKSYDRVLEAIGFGMHEGLQRGTPLLQSQRGLHLWCPAILASHLTLDRQVKRSSTRRRRP
jgi:hypothetical protein